MSELSAISLFILCAIILCYAAALSGALDYELVRSILLLYLFACALVGLGNLGRLLVVHRRNPQVRSQLVIMLGGSALSVVPPLFGGLLPILTTGQPSVLGLYTGGLALGILPLPFAYAITQHELLGIRSLVRRSVVYLVMAFILLSVLSGAAAAMGAVMPDGWANGELAPFGVAFMVFVAAIFFPHMQRRVERMVDRYIYHDAYDYKAAVEEFISQLATESDINNLAGELVRKTCQLMNLEGGALLLDGKPSEWGTSKLEDQRQSDFLATGYLRGGQLGRVKPTVYASYGVHVSRMVDVVRVEMANWEPATAHRGTILQYSDGAEQPSSVLCLPLWTRGKFLGVLSLAGKRTGEPFTDDDLSLLTTLAAQAATAIHNAQLYMGKQCALLDTISALARAIEAKDGYTAEHCEHMISRAEAVAEAMGLEKDNVENVRLGAILHDVGKIGIPDAVLNKPARLTAEEFTLMKTHAAIGADIVSNVGALQGVVPIVRHHHERYDGGGYPAGLAGSDIPIGARIIAVVDTYGAMTEDRVYRKAPGHERAVTEIGRYARSQFDPEVADIFLRVLKHKPWLQSNPSKLATGPIEPAAARASVPTGNATSTATSADTGAAIGATTTVFLPLSLPPRVGQEHENEIVHDRSTASAIAAGL